MNTDRVVLFDTTLRDGEQSPGVSLDKAEKLEIARQLARLGVDVVEAGFPVASPGDFEAVQAIARAFDDEGAPVVAGLARAYSTDIETAWAAVRDAARPRIHTFVSTSDIHIEHQLRCTREDVKGLARAAVAHARWLCGDVEFSPMDATRADPELTAEVIQIALDEGATTINVPDTVGYAMPDEYRALLERLYELVPDLHSAVLSVHCHDDLGLAVANTFAGVLAGARQVECAINGIGERAGNASLEELVMLLHTRRADVGLVTRAETTELARTSRLVSRLTGYPVQPNKAIVGRNAFAHESGIHQDGVLKERTTYEIIDARTVGADDADHIVLGKHSGRHALKRALAEIGYDLDGAALRQAFERFKEVADRTKRVTALDLEALIAEDIREGAPAYALEWFEVEAGNRRPPHAKVAVRTPAGALTEGSFTGDGPIDAIFRAINAATGLQPHLRDFRIGAVTGGHDALGETSVVLEVDGWSATGQAVSPDILEAAARAYLRAMSLGARKPDEAGPAAGEPSGGAGVVALSLVAAAGFGAFFLLLDAGTAAAPGGELGRSSASLSARCRRRSPPRSAPVSRCVSLARAPADRRRRAVRPRGRRLADLRGRQGDLATVAVLASLDPLVTVLLALSLRHERLPRWQSAGVVLCLGGVVLLAAG